MSKNRALTQPVGYSQIRPGYPAGIVLPSRLNGTMGPVEAGRTIHYSVTSSKCD